MTLTEFLLARIAEDEAVAQAAIERSDRVWENESRLGRVWTAENDEGRVINMPALRSPLGPHIARHDPARVLAECEARRLIVEAHPHRDQDNLGCETCDWQPWWPGTFREPCPTLRALALPYADHPDFDEAWRP